VSRVPNNGMRAERDYTGGHCPDVQIMY
jgi:hypothetical protein